MKLSKANSSLLLLLLASISGSVARGDANDDSIALNLDTRRAGVPTKDAPVDGKDGKPHLGPFVETDAAAERETQERPQLRGRPDDPTVVDGKRIPESNDGVMFDKNREHPQEGTTGTEGGVSEKDRVRKAQEGRTGSKVVTQPEAPKEQPPLPHSEEEKIHASNVKQVTDEDADGYTGLDKPDDLPEKPQHVIPPVPDSANKDHLDLSDSEDGTATHKDTDTDSDDSEGVIQPFHSFILSFTMILVSEVGDKTFLVACLMAMKHDRMVVFTAAFGALLVMTVLSAVLGHAVPVLIPKRWTSFLASLLFFVFGGRLLKEGLEMDPNEGVTAEMHEVEQELAEKEKELAKNQRDTVSPYALEMGIGTRQPRSNSRYHSPPRSPSQSPPPHRGSGTDGLRSALQGAGNLFSLILSPAWVQTFVMTFLGEWGDRSQIATIAMSAGQDYWWVTLGALCGHAICTGVAVIGGRAIAGRVSLKVVTVGGAVAFLVFGVIYLIESYYG
ncbi:hypothetical protein S7711_05879 [Stachybotrys chartarum IBT 7711]|uniref:GDT1 family protein n=1 Tax=Stachybotrys chartarum (strain CBS 109288 / IBT 7711) TaxID=1280523 RepID=A0A084AKP8_STACB|nr:hypothetical protein S7711_05879 [Stachybotrys chartarum IBT 7711]KFA51529.1 hypothetical protein S40293_06345 [Stachybotrys chartarum IBT 40293]KFA75338.1 hypothetical protein S40288_01980 [Stachybotrys chartarum IBT 40288]